MNIPDDDCSYVGNVNDGAVLSRVSLVSFWKFMIYRKGNSAFLRIFLSKVLKQ